MLDPNRAGPGPHSRSADVGAIKVADSAATPTSILANEVVSALFHGSHDLVAACDSEGFVLIANPALTTFAGLDSTDVLPGHWSDFGISHAVDGQPGAPEGLLLARALRGEAVDGMEIVLEAKGGARRTMIAEAQRLLGVDGAVLGAMVVCRDVTAERAAAAQLSFHVLHDTLTGLPNRELFIQRVRAALGRAGRYQWSTAVLALNLDHFSYISNRVGEASSNELLAEVARRLTATVRPYDSVSVPVDTVARLGGDQFLLLCEDITDARSAELVAHRIDLALRVPMTVAGTSVTITAGIGITVTDDAHHDAEALILEAETAMRAAKTGGTGRQERFAREMQSLMRSRIEDEDALRDAHARQEFRIAYQPKVSLLTDRTTGVEALLRWHHPLRGVIQPMDFIPLAEESGLIVPIGVWVLEQVCRDAERWRRALPGGLPLMIAINVSPRQFELGLAETFGAVIERAGIDPETLCVEVTESMVMQDAELAITILRELKEIGVRISVDDFGTGFSSLAYLKRFPLDEIKIDKSFVDGLGHDPEATAIVAAVMGMAHALSLHVVAEGVETADQVARLRTLGCDEAQGFHFARPSTADAIDALLLAESAPRSESQNTFTIRGTPPQGGARKILVVDDAADVRQLARSSLAAVGFEVHEASSGEEAITMARTHKPDCVVLDVNLPGISGLEVCRILRKDHRHRTTTIVMLTGDAAPAEKVQAFSLEADDYMVKPFSPRDLVSRVTSSMRRRNAMVVDRA